MTAAAPRGGGGRRRQPTTTARFGSSRRESHDASAFYERFVAPEVSSDEAVCRPEAVDVLYTADARHMHQVPPGSVALVVTSPPYFAGKEYEQTLGAGGVPATYFEYLALLADVFAECKRVLEPGGRIAVNVANLGRRPYRSLAGDVTQILQDLGLLLRGEVVWWKGRAAGGSCAWGSFQRPANPVLRDITERVVIASKGRFDRAIAPGKRHHRGLPSTTTISRDEFLEATTDLWELSPESATKVGHPAPFPVELPQRLIELFTYEGDVVLDPFMGSGTTAVAAVRTGRHYVGFDTDAAYVHQARRRVAEERRQVTAPPLAVRIGPGAGSDGAAATPLAAAVREGRGVRELAAILLEDSGFADIRAEVKVPGAGLDVGFLARDRRGGEWAFEVCGTYSLSRSGLRRADTLWRAVGRAAALHHGGGGRPLVVLATAVPAAGSPGATALEAVTGRGRPIHDVVDLLDPAGHDRLRTYAAGHPRP